MFEPCIFQSTNHQRVDRPKGDCCGPCEGLVLATSHAGCVFGEPLDLQGGQPKTS